MAKKTILLLACLLLLPCGLSSAQSGGLDSFGSGVHQYFSGQHQAAIESLNSAIGNDKKNARAYFFRGLAQLAAGNTVAAEADIQLGAKIEADKGTRRSRLVTRSLERIQGELRIQIERARTNAFHPGSIETLTLVAPKIAGSNSNNPPALENLAPIASSTPSTSNATITSAPPMIYSSPIISNQVYQQPIISSSICPQPIYFQPGCPPVILPTQVVPQPFAQQPIMSQPIYGAPISEGAVVDTVQPAEVGTVTAAPSDGAVLPTLASPMPDSNESGLGNAGGSSEVASDESSIVGAPSVTEPAKESSSVLEETVVDDAASIEPAKAEVPAKSEPIESSATEPEAAAAKKIELLPQPNLQGNEPVEVEPSQVKPVTEPKPTALPVEAPLNSPPTAEAPDDPFGAAKTEPKATEATPFESPTSEAAEKPAVETDDSPFGQAVPDKAKSDDPFGEAKPTEPAKPAANDPFGAATTEPARPAASDPFAAATNEPAKPAADDPFGAATTEPAKPAANDPFGEAKPTEPAKPAANDPFGAATTEPAKPAANDPFGGATTEPAKPAADDPFGAGSKPAKDSEVADDPFGF